MLSYKFVDDNRTTVDASEYFIYKAGFCFIYIFGSSEGKNPHCLNLEIFWLLHNYNPVHK